MTCKKCNKKIKSDDIGFYDIDHNIICVDCFIESECVCESCGNIFVIGSNRYKSKSGKIICQNCFNDLKEKIGSMVLIVGIKCCICGRKLTSEYIRKHGARTSVNDKGEFSEVMCHDCAVKLWGEDNR